MTRCTYNLLDAAAQEGVTKVVYLSTLDLMLRYDPSLEVMDRWRPLPTTEPRVLGKHLGEYVCREFAREQKIDGAVLRLGHVITQTGASGRPFDPLWVDHHDVAQAVALALAVATGRWSVFHIGADMPTARFAIGDAKRVLGYSPATRFAV